MLALVSSCGMTPAAGGYPCSPMYFNLHKTVAYVRLGISRYTCRHQDYSQTDLAHDLGSARAIGRLNFKVDVSVLTPRLILRRVRSFAVFDRNPKSNLPPCFRLRFQLPHAASRSYSVVLILPQLYGLVLSASQQPLDCGTHTTLTLRFGLERLLMHIKPI